MKNPKNDNDDIIHVLKLKAGKYDFDVEDLILSFHDVLNLINTLETEKRINWNDENEGKGILKSAIKNIQIAVCNYPDLKNKLK
jgi:hypothetical protein